MVMGIGGIAYLFTLSPKLTGGILLGSEYHFELTRAGVGLYGGRPFADARPVVALARSEPPRLR